MNIRNLIIILIALIVGGGGIYLASRYFMKPQQPFITQNLDKPLDKSLDKPLDKTLERMTQPINFEDTKLQPYFDISIDDKPQGRVIIQLFDDEVPKTCKNFRFLCSKGLFDKSKPAYQDSTFHRVIKDFMVQGGDITRGDGTGGFSMYGEHFEDENFNLTHNQPGILSMANAGPNTNNSQFFVTLKKTPWLDNKHVVFGIVISGFEIFKKIESLPVGENDKPANVVAISGCGLTNPEDPGDPGDLDLEN